MRSFRGAAFAASLCVLACGGEDKGPRPDPVLCRPLLPLSDQPDPGSGPVDCRALDGYELFLIEDFEPNNYQFGWYVNNDRTAEQIPVPEEEPPRTTDIPGGRCLGVEPSENAATLCDDPTVPRGECTTVVTPESRAAMRIISGFLSSAGGVFGRNFPKVDCITPVQDDPSTQCPLQPGPPEIGPCSFANGPSPPLLGCRAARDTSEWDGVVFWGRVGPNSVPSVRVRVSDQRTDEASCICSPYTNQNDPSNGCDKFGRHVTLDGTYRAHFVPFDEMQQGGWGLKSPGLDRAGLLSVAFEYGRGAWDLWIDDVALYRRRP